MPVVAADRQPDRISDGTGNPGGVRVVTTTAIDDAIVDIIATEFGGSNPGYQASPIKRRRRTKAEIAALDEAIYAVAEENQPATVRQIYYRLVSAGAARRYVGQA